MQNFDISTAKGEGGRSANAATREKRSKQPVAVSVPKKKGCRNMRGICCEGGRGRIGGLWGEGDASFR